MTIYALCEKPYVNKQRFFDSFSKGASTKVLNTFLACFDIPLTPSLYKKWSFQLRISSVIVTKSVVTFAEEILNRKRPSQYPCGQNLTIKTNKKIQRNIIITNH